MHCWHSRLISSWRLIAVFSDGVEEDKFEASWHDGGDKGVIIKIVACVFSIKR